MEIFLSVTFSIGTELTDKFVYCCRKEYHSTIAVIENVLFCLMRYTHTGTVFGNPPGTKSTLEIITQATVFQHYYVCSVCLLDSQKASA
jgi:hypothetical protein